MVRFQRGKATETYILPHWRRNVLRILISWNAAAALEWKQVVPMNEKKAEAQFKQSLSKINATELPGEIRSRYIEFKKLNRNVLFRKIFLQRLNF